MMQLLIASSSLVRTMHENDGHKQGADCLHVWSPTAVVDLFEQV